MGFFQDLGNLGSSFFTGRWTGGENSVGDVVSRDPWVLAPVALATAGLGAGALGALGGLGLGAAADVGLTGAALGEAGLGAGTAGAIDAGLGAGVGTLAAPTAGGLGGSLSTLDA